MSKTFKIRQLAAGALFGLANIGVLTLLTSRQSAKAVVVPPSGDVAVVVNAKTPVDSLSIGELRKVLMGERQFWTAGQRITLLIRAPAAHERDVILKKVYQMSESQFKQYWVAKVFRAEAPAGPKVIYSNQTAIELVNNLPGSVAFLETSQVPKGAKVVKIDGRLPGEKGYSLQ